jgi:hypothetical protein
MQVEAKMVHKWLTNFHKIHHGPNLRRVTILFHIIYFMFGWAIFKIKELKRIVTHEKFINIYNF